VCVLAKDRRLVLWVPKPLDTEIAINVDKQELEEAGESIGEGQRFALVIPPAAERVKVLRKGPGSKRAAWSILLSPPRSPKPGERDVQGEIKSRTGRTPAGDGTFELIQALEFNRARASLHDLEALAPSADLPAVSRYFLRFFHALLTDKEGDYRQALEELDRSIAISEHVGDKPNHWFATQKRALVLANLGRSDEAAETFARLAEELPAGIPCEVGKFFNNWAWTTLLAREAGGGRELIGPASGVEPGKLLERAIEVFLANLETCAASDLFNSRLNLVLAHLQDGRVDLAAQALAAARAAKTESTLFQEVWELDLEARIDLARDRPQAALEIYRRLDQIAESVGAPDGRLRAALGRARATAQLGDRAGALSILAEAEDLLDGQSLQVPLYEGRMTFVSQREGVASLEVQLLLDAGRVAEALAAARRARSRVLRQLDLAERLASLAPEERKRWGDEIGSYTRARADIDSSLHGEWGLLSGELAGERAARERKAREAGGQLENALALLGPAQKEQPLAPIPPSELLLAFHPLPRNPGVPAVEWVAFAAHGDQLTFRRFSLTSALADDDALARATLTPFRKEILSAQRIRILPYGALRDVDFHALPFGADVLLAAKPVVYGLDLRPAAEATGTPRRTERRQPEALIVANPSTTLPGTVAEAKAVAREIHSWTAPWRIEKLEGAEAQADVVSRRLKSVELFHFAGHGRFAGVGGSDSSLLLADDQRLNVGQILVLGGAPRFVILSGCETGSTGPESRVEGLGLANAFVLAGSRAVIASVRLVDDRSAEPLFSEFYRRWQGGQDLAGALQQALLAWRHTHPKADWRSFRLIEP
jgi:tetratricopeptide (TPR) repeat protein